MSKTRILYSATILLLLALVGSCKLKNPDFVDTSAAASPAPLSNSMQGSQAVSQVNQAKELSYNSTLVLKSLGDQALLIMNTDPTLANTATPRACSDYGQFSYTGTASSGTYNLTLTFNLCRMNGFQFDGTYSLQGTPANFSIVLGSTTSAFRIVDFNDRTYAAITGTMTLEGLRLQMAGTSSAGSEQYTLTANGEFKTFDYYLLKQITVRMTNLISSYTSTVEAGTNNKATTVQTNGAVLEYWMGGGSISLTYTGLTVSKLEQYLATTPTGTVYSGSDTTVNGTTTFSIFSTGTTMGVSGIISVVTSTATPIHHNYSSGLTTAGTMTVSGNGEALATFLTGTIDVTVAPNAPVSFANEYFLNHSVKFFSLEQVLPAVMGTTGTATTVAAVGTTWPATMTITGLSSAPTTTDLQCYTDVHVNYYSPADFVLTPPTLTWYIDYHVSGTCTDPPGIPFEQALNITSPDATCDVGLDINGADKDYTSGGVEHYTGNQMPQGYYVVSINNYNCDQTKVTNQGSIIIGDYLFGPYNCTYTASSADGTTPGAWCRLADIRMNSDGSADVLAPGTFASTFPWHP